MCSIYRDPLFRLVKNVHVSGIEESKWAYLTQRFFRTELSSVLKMWSREWLQYVLTSLSGIGIITNLHSFLYIKRTFNTKDNLFNILIKDSLLATLCAILRFATDLIILADLDFMRTKIFCILSHYGGFLGVIIGPLITLLISIRRYIQLKYPTRIKIDSKKINIITTVSIALASVYYLGFLFLDTFGDLHQINYIMLCLGTLDGLKNEPVSYFKRFLITLS